MAQNDMEVIVYKILRYLYACNKEGKIPTFSDMFNTLELSGVSQSYLGQILEEMADKNYIAGCIFRKTKGWAIITFADDARITLDGVSFLNENSRMKKAAEFAGRAFEILLESVISAALSK